MGKMTFGDRDGSLSRSQILMLRLLVLALFLQFVSAAAKADRDIVFAAQHYKWSSRYYQDSYGGKPERTLDDVGPSHIYRINPDGSGLKQITFGKDEDLYPEWTSDCRKILFVRCDENHTNNRICTVSSSGGPVRVIRKIKNDCYRRPFKLSPSGRFVSYLSGGGSRDINKVNLIDLRTNRVQSFEDLSDYAWSPDSKSLFLVSDKYNPQAIRPNRIVDIASGREVGISGQFVCPVWIDNQSVMGIQQVSENDNVNYVIRIVGVDGTELRHIDIRIETLNTYGDHLWKRIPGQPENFVYQSHNGMSDGSHYKCILINTHSAKSKELGKGCMVGISPDGKQIAMADRNWAGPYKRGGRRCGPLRIMDLKTGNEREITGKLMSIEGGDWRRGGRD